MNLNKQEDGLTKSTSQTKPTDQTNQPEASRRTKSNQPIKPPVKLNE